MGTATYEISDFVPQEVSREDWGRYHAFRRTRHAIVDPNDPITPDDVDERSMLHHDEFKEMIRGQVLSADRMIGFGRMSRVLPNSPEYAENKHLAWTRIEVLPEFQRQGIGTAWFQRVADFMDRNDMTVVGAATFEDSGHAFLRKLGGVPKMIEQDNRLYLSDVDWDMVRAWIEDGQSRSPGASIELYADHLPEEIWGEYLPVYTEIANDMPLEDLEAGADVFDEATWRNIAQWMEQIGAEHHTMLTREPDGSISGLTDVLYQPATPTVVHQWSTGVIRKHRGRRIGSWLKAAMLMYLRESYPAVEYIQTENAHSNDPMLSINRALGFKLHREWTTYQAGIDQLRKALP